MYIVLMKPGNHNIKLGDSIWDGWKHQVGYTGYGGLKAFKLHLSTSYPNAVWESSNGGMLETVTCNGLTFGILELRVLFPAKSHSYYASQMKMLKSLLPGKMPADESEGQR